LPTEQDAVSILAFERGVDTTLEIVRGDNPEHEAEREHIAAAAALVRVALGITPPEGVPAISAIEPVAGALNTLRRSYLAAVDGLADTAVSHNTDLVSDAMERVSAVLAAAQAGTNGRAAEEVAAEAASTNAAGTDVAPHFGLSPVDPIVSLTHDMRSPLTSILFLIEWVRASNTGPLSTAQDRALGLVYSAAFGLSSMVNDVLMLARGDVEDPTAVAFSLVELVRGVEHIVAPIAEQRQLTLTLVLPENDVPRYGRPVRLSRVLLNLVTNALKFTEHGTVTVCAREIDTSHVEFTVGDTGRGIPPELLPTLLDPFRALAKRDFRGRRHVFSSAGLGLSICQTLLHMMDSELRVESTLGEGTRFSFVLELPISPPAART
jgi:signal transduction histidine kinase